MLQRLAETDRNAGSPLTVNGKTIVAMHGQLVGILRSRLGQNHADFLAVPAVSDRGILWKTALAGEVAQASQLPEEAQAALKKRAQRIQTDIQGLAAQLRAEGQASSVVATMLAQATVHPAGDWLYSVGGRPVTILWGHVSEGADAVVVVPTGAGSPDGAVASVAADSTGPSAQGKSAHAAAPADVSLSPGQAPGSAQDVPAPGKKRWLLWLLMFVVVLAALLLGLRACTPVLWPEPVDLTDQIRGAEDAAKSLRDEIARREAALAERDGLMCVPDAPAEPQRPPELPGAVLLPAEPLPPVTEAPAPAVSPPAPSVSPSTVAPSITPPPVRAPVVPQADRPADKPPVARSQACKPRLPGEEPELVVVFDASGSMREPIRGAASRLAAAQASAAGMIRGLPDGVDIGLVEFSACGKVRRDKFYRSGERPALISEINRLQPKEGTPLAAAITRAGAVASGFAESVIVVVSDGGDSCGGDPCAAARALKAAKPNVVINVLDMSVTAAERQVLQCVARAGGGKLLAPGDAPDMTRKMKEAAGPANCP